MLIKTIQNKAQSTYPFGTPLYNRGFSIGSGYKYGYQGSEKDNEVKGGGNSYTTEFRILDTRLARWLSIDPETSTIPWESPYTSMSNKPIWLNDPLGDKVINGDEDNLKEKKKNKENKKAEYDNAKGIKKFFKGISYAIANATCNLAQNKYDESQKIIDDYKAKNPEDFDCLDNLKSQAGDNVDVYVTKESGLKAASDDMDKPDGTYLDGLTSMHYTTKTDDKGKVQSIPASPNGSNTVTVKISSSAGSKNKSLGHEFGHVWFNVTHAKEYKFWKIRNPDAPKGGHGKAPASGEANPSGHEAEEWHDRTK